MFLACSLIFIYLIYKIKIENDWLDAIIAPIILMTTTFSTLGLPKQLQESTALVPALQSNWLMMHVTMMILSYGALLFGSLLGVTLLTLTFVSPPPKKNFFLYASNSLQTSNNINLIGDIKKSKIVKISLPGPTAQDANKYTLDLIKQTANALLKKSPTVRQDPQDFLQKSKKTTQEKIQETKVISNPALAIRAPGGPKSNAPNWNLENIGLLKIIYLRKYKAVLLNQIDYWSYRIIGIGFPLLTLGILSGAVWANEAWGSYWNWDPKETWALITWVIFAIYLHIRITKGWNGTKPALVALLGFFVVWMCYLGVNLLGKGLHSYGWLN